MVEINLKLIKSLRETHCFSISDMAEYLGYKTPTSYWLLECGKRNISVIVLYKISKLYNLTMEDFLIVREEERNINSGHKKTS